MLFHYFVCVLDKSSDNIDNFVEAQFLLSQLRQWQIYKSMEK